MTTMPRTPTVLHKLLALRLARKMDEKEFCEAFEHAYNFEVRDEDLAPKERAAFAELFDTVALFTPNEAHRLELPTHFKDSAQLAAAVQRAHDALYGQPPPARKP